MLILFCNRNATVFTNTRVVETQPGYKIQRSPIKTLTEPGSKSGWQRQLQVSRLLHPLYPPPPTTVFDVNKVDFSVVGRLTLLPVKCFRFIYIKLDGTQLSQTQSFVLRGGGGAGGSYLSAPLLPGKHFTLLYQNFIPPKAGSEFPWLHSLAQFLFLFLKANQQNLNICLMMLR